mgnify:CR=1 FL=1
MQTNSSPKINQGLAGLSVHCSMTQWHQASHAKNMACLEPVSMTHCKPRIYILLVVKLRFFHILEGKIIRSQRSTKLIIHGLNIVFRIDAVAPA